MSELTLTALAHKRAADTSYGDQRRLDLALALIGRPKILLLDEPAAGLSIKESLDLAHNLKDLAARWDVTVLLVEHDMEVVFSICDRITVLHLGDILAEGTPDEIRANPGSDHGLSRKRRMSELLGFSNVVSGYGDARILHDVDLTIGEGERVAILGRNGVGKTTVVNTFLGVARLTGRRGAHRRKARNAISVILPRRGSALPWCRRAGASSPP